MRRFPGSSRRSQEAIVRDEAGLASCREFYENRERLLAFYDIIQAQVEQKARQDAGEKRKKQLEDKLLRQQSDYLAQEKEAGEKQQALTEAQNRYRRGCNRACGPVGGGGKALSRLRFPGTSEGSAR